MEEKKRLSLKRIVLLGLCLVIVGLLCCVWIRTDSELFARKSFSLWNVSALINGLSSASPWLASMEADRAGLVTTAMSVVAYIWLAFVFYELLQSLWSALSPGRRLRLGGYIVPGTLALLAICLPLILEALSDGGLVRTLEVGAAPYALVGVCLFALAANFILDEKPAAEKKPDPAPPARPAVQELALPKISSLVPRHAPPMATAAERKTTEHKAADVKKTEGGLNVPYKTLGGVRLFPINLYDPRAKLRPVYAGLDREKSAIQLRLVSYSQAGISAVRADVELVTPFGESVRLEKLSFTELLERSVRCGREYVSEFLKVDAEKEFLRQTHEIRVYLRSAVCGGKLCDMPEGMSYTLSAVEPGRLDALRAEYGIDAMEQPGQRAKGWMCCCGRLNGSGESRCHVCGRDRSDCVSRSEEIKYCATCGAKLTGDQHFCYRCGTRSEG